MGTEFQYAINPLAEKRKNISFTVGRLDDWDYLKRKTKEGDSQKSAGFISFEDSMDKLIEKKSIEYIKRTMLTHENIFKHQVSELHRLYNMQKILMNESRNGITKIIHEDHIPTTNASDLKQLAIDKKGQLDEQSPHIARTSVWVGSDTSATNRMVNDGEHCLLHTQIVHNSSIYTTTENKDSDICKEDGAKYEECDVDLTLGIGGNNNKQSKTEGSSSNQKSSSLPHWLYQGLGSDKTI